MMDKESILAEIKRTAKANGGRPLGRQRFEQETGIKSHEWQRYWARIGDAQTEAGFSRNILQEAYPEEFLLQKVAELTRSLGRIPISNEFRVAEHGDDSFPSHTTFYKLGSKQDLIRKMIDFCRAHPDFTDFVAMYEGALRMPVESEDPNGSASEISIGEVYLFKSGRYYKIGKTFDTVRRGAELRIQLPEELHLVHSIKTDDPSGIEAYWHRRFDSKRMNGEWFDLKQADIKAFKMWKRIV